MIKLWTPRDIDAVLDRVLLTVDKPGRYTGGEHNQVVNDWAAAPVRVALAFPDIYELGMSNLGLAILYDILNRRAGILCERVYCPWSDMEAVMRREGLPLYSLETHHPLNEFDLIGVSLPYEQLYSNVLNLLDLGGVPVRAADRDATHPIVLAGGHATYNPDPMADFVDAFAIGEGEEVIVEVARCIEQWKREGHRSRSDLLRGLARIEGVYVPSLYDVAYHLDGTIARVQPIEPELPARVSKRIVPVLPPPITKFIVPTSISRTTARRSRSCAAARAAAASATRAWSRDRCANARSTKCWPRSKRSCARPALKRSRCCRCRPATIPASSNWRPRLVRNLRDSICRFRCRRCALNRLRPI